MNPTYHLSTQGNSSPAQRMHTDLTNESEQAYDGSALDGPGMDELDPELQTDGQYADEQELAESNPISMRELLHEHPQAVIQYIEERGVLKLGEISVQDYQLLKVLRGSNLMTCGQEHLKCDWKALWNDLLVSRSEPTIRAGWSDTQRTMEAHVVTIKHAAAPGHHGLLQPLLRRYQAHACSIRVFGLPAVQAVIDFKWTTWAQRFLVYELLCYLVWLASFTAFTLLYEYEQEEVSLASLLDTPLGCATVACNLIAFAAMLPFMYMEVCTICAYQSGWWNLWNALDSVSYVLQIMITLIHLQRTHLDEATFPVLLSLQHIFLWFKLHYFARVLSPGKNLVVDTLRVLLQDMQWFLVFLMLTMLGFAFAFFSLFRHDRDVPDFVNFWTAMASMIEYLLAMFDFNLFYNSTNATAVMVLFIFYSVVMVIMLLNIMIAIMTSSFNNIKKHEGLRLLYSRAQIIDELEATLPHWLRRASWSPAFVHILKEHPESALQQYNLSSVLSGIGTLESNLLKAQEDVRMRMSEVEAKVTLAHERMQTAIGLLEAMLRASGRQGVTAVDADVFK